MGSYYDQFKFMETLNLQRILDTIPPVLDNSYANFLPDENGLLPYVEWGVYTKPNVRRAPIINRLNSAPVRQDSRSLDKRRVEVATVRIKTPLDELDLIGFEIPGSLREKISQDQVTEAIAQRRADCLMTKNWMAWQALLTGHLQYTSNDLAIDIDYLYDAGTQFDNTVNWHTAALKDIRAQLRGHMKSMRIDQGVDSFELWMNSNTQENLETNSNVIAAMDNDLHAMDILKGTNLVQQLNGLTPRIFDGKVYDEDGNGTLILPDNKVVLFGRAAGMRYGYFYNSRSLTNDGREVMGMFADRYMQDDPVVEFLRVGFSGVPVIERPGFVRVLTVG